MISLARHIELLLLEHDCVIVPGLGGFIASHATAQLDNSNETLFLPPYRTIGFNQQLQMNDGLLVQSYMTAYDASYPAAYLQMEKEVELMLIALDQEGTYDLQGVGTLTKSLNQNITFTSVESGMLTPSLYGLYSFEMKTLSAIQKEREINESLSAASMQVNAGNATKASEDENSKKDVVIHLRRRWIDFSVSAAAAVILFFCLSYQAINSSSFESSDTCVAAICTNNTADPAQVSRTSKNTAAANENKDATAQQAHNQDNKKVAAEENIKNNAKLNAENQAEAKAKAEAETKAKAESEAKATQASNKFSIVLASYVSESNANEYIQQIAKQGFTEAKFVKTGKVSRIIYSDYPTEKDAFAALYNLRKESNEFDEAWVIEL